MSKDIKLKIFVIFILTIISCYIISPVANKPLFRPGELLSNVGIKLGLDLQGGAEIRLEFASSEKLSSEDKKKGIVNAIGILERRINVFGLQEPRIQAFGNDQILVQLPGASQDEIDRIKKLLQRAGNVELRLVLKSEERDKYTPPQTKPGYKWFDTHPQSGLADKLLLRDEVALKGEHIVTARVGVGGGHEELGSQMYYHVSFKLDTEGAKSFAKLTSQHVGEQLAILLDGVVQSAPNIKEPITHGEGVITGRFSREEAEDLANILKTGSLPAPLRIVGEESIGPSLGDEAIKQGKYAILFSITLVIIFMIVYYGISGVASILALVLNVLLILTLLALFRATLTLPGIAGIILTMGMAVDANILIFERIREEIAAGKSLLQAFEAGHERALSAIIDSNVTTLFTGIILSIFGSGPVKGFGITLSIGCITTVFTQVYCAKWLLQSLMYSGILKNFKFMRLFSNPNLNLMKLRTICLFLSGLSILIGIGFFIYRGQSNFSVDFTSGTVLGMKLKQPIQISKVREIVANIKKDGKAKYPDAEIQGIGIAKEAKKGFLGSALYDSFQIRTGASAQDEVKKDMRIAFKEYMYEEPIPPDEIVYNIQEKGPQEGHGKLRLNLPEPRIVEEFKKEIKDFFSNEGWKEPFIKEIDIEQTNKSRHYYVYIKPEDTKEMETIISRLQTHLNLGNVNPFIYVNNIGPQVAKDLKEKAFWSVILSWLVMIIYLWWRFEFIFGLAAVIALIHDVLIAVGFTSIFSAFASHTLDITLQMGLATVASLLAIIGYSVNDTIVVFDRLRENMNILRHESFINLINKSVNQTLSRTILTSLTVFLVAVTLFVFTAHSVTGIPAFAFPFIIGTIVGTYSSIYIASSLVAYFRK